MSEFKNHWTSEKPETLPKIEKFDEETIYEIKNVEKIKN